MRVKKRFFRLAAGTAIVALSATTAHATTVQELVRIKGHENNTLTGMGMVIGLNGTGDDSRQALLAARPYGELFRNLGNAALSIAELAEADAFAIVQVTMEVPAVGVREGDRVDVYVDTMFNATSLAGGRLYVSPLRLPLPDSNELLPMALATGKVIIQGDNPRGGVVRAGGQMLADIRAHPVTAAGTMGLVLKDQYASFPVAITIAAAINDEFALDGLSQIAIVEDAKNIKVLVPAVERRYPANFIATLITIAIDPSLIQTEARIVINEREGIIVVTGNVEISPVGITHKGLSISSITPGLQGQQLPGFPGAGAVAPVQATPRRWAGLDTTGRQSRNSTRLLELLRAFDQLMVPVKDQIAIIYELQKTGALHAKIVSE
jgi:flagellar P-ring protein precursor FlgI